MFPRQKERLLAFLKRTNLLEGYSLSIFTSDKEAIPEEIDRELCGAQGIPHLCREVCAPSLTAAVGNAMANGKPIFFRCPLGLLSFALPISVDSCLVCGGVRESLFDLYFREAEESEFLKGKKKAHPYEILEQLEKLPVITEKDARETMLKVERLISSFTSEERLPQYGSSNSLESAIIKIAESICRADTASSAISLYGETLGILFDIPAVAIALKDEESNCCITQGCWGTFPLPPHFPFDTLPFKENEFSPMTLSGEELSTLFPKMGMTSALCLPLGSDHDLFGMCALFDVSLTDQKLELVGILTRKLARRLQQTVSCREARLRQRDIRLLEMIRALALEESHEELPRLIIGMAAELVEAENGSLMLFDSDTKILRIASALGVNPLLAQYLYATMGDGIAGRVAASGTPLLVRDIEKEFEPPRRNRTRFRTRSCISMPLSCKGELVGVLNLADKHDQAPFTSTDMEILATFLDQAVIFLERSTILAKAKQSIITDQLTGLYNSRFIRKRLNEELSRSIRHNLALTLIIVCLDDIASVQGASQTNHDQRIKEMARVLGASLRDIDLIGYLGKAEFCIILPSTQMKDSIHVADRIKRSMEIEFSRHNEQDQEKEAVCIGIASFPENGASTNEMINSARSALCRAEAKGENKTCFSVNEQSMKPEAAQGRNFVKPQLR